MYKEDLALNNLQWLICHKTKPNQIIYIEYVCMLYRGKEPIHSVTVNYLLTQVVHFD